MKFQLINGPAHGRDVEALPDVGGTIRINVSIMDSKISSEPIKKVLTYRISNMAMFVKEEPA
jgi:hypothetical protein